MNKTKPLVVFGSGEIASLARFYFQNDSDYEVVAFTVDDAYADAASFEGLPLVRFSDVHRRFPPDDHHMFVGLSYSRLNQFREEKYIAAKHAGYVLASYICSRSITWPDLATGDNCFILENQTIQPTAIIGNDVMLWSGNHIGHGSRIGDHTYVASHVVISGHCQIGQRCFFGVNSTVRDFCVIGDDCFIAMGASVAGNLEPGSVVIGQSGEIFKADDRRARVLKKKYFKF